MDIVIEGVSAEIVREKVRQCGVAREKWHRYNMTRVGWDRDIDDQLRSEYLEAAAEVYFEMTCVCAEAG